MFLYFHRKLHSTPFHTSQKSSPPSSTAVNSFFNHDLNSLHQSPYKPHITPHQNQLKQTQLLNHCDNLCATVFHLIHIQITTYENSLSPFHFPAIVKQRKTKQLHIVYNSFKLNLHGFTFLLNISESNCNNTHTAQPCTNKINHASTPFSLCHWRCSIHIPYYFYFDLFY